MSSRFDNEFENELKRTLDTGADRVDQATRDELARRRRHVLDVADQTPSRSGLWVPASGLAAALLAALLVQPFLNSAMPDTTVADSDDIDTEILLAEEGLELYEDLEFYEWLDVAGDAG